MALNFVYALNTVIAIAWVLSLAYALIQLRKLEINPTARAVWGALIVLIPFVGVIAFLLATGKQRA